MGNEVADRLAKRGTEDRDIHGPLPHIPVSQNIIKKHIKEWGFFKHTKEWEQRGDCRQTKMFLPKVPPKAFHGFWTVTRSKARKLIQLLTGHNNLKRHRFLMKMEDDPICNKCGEEEETSEHFIAKCPAYARQRRQYLGSYFLRTEDLANLGTRKIMRYADETGRLENLVS